MLKKAIKFHLEKSIDSYRKSIDFVWKSIDVPNEVILEMFLGRHFFLSPCHHPFLLGGGGVILYPLELISMIILLGVILYPNRSGTNFGVKPIMGCLINWWLRLCEMSLTLPRPRDSNCEELVPMNQSRCDINVAWHLKHVVHTYFRVVEIYDSYCIPCQHKPSMQGPCATFHNVLLQKGGVSRVQSIPQAESSAMDLSYPR